MIVALTVLSVGVVTTMAALSVSSRAATRSLRHDQAASLAERQLELACLAPADRLLPGGAAEGMFAWTSVYTGKASNLTLATVTVTWQDAGEAQAFALSKLFAPRKPSSSSPDNSGAGE